MAGATVSLTWKRQPLATCFSSMPRSGASQAAAMALSAVTISGLAGGSASSSNSRCSRSSESGLSAAVMAASRMAINLV